MLPDSQRSEPVFPINSPSSTGNQDNTERQQREGGGEPFMQQVILLDVPHFLTAYFLNSYAEMWLKAA